MEVQIPLRNKKHDIVGYAIIDEEDKERVEPIYWSLNRNGYVEGHVLGKPVLMHRFIINAPPATIVDHKNNIRHDNRKNNLHIVSYAFNSQNKQKKLGTVSKYIGVSFYPKNAPKPWTAVSQNNHIGNFEHEVHAAYAYDQETLKRFGQFAKTNKLERPIDYVEVVKRQSTVRVEINGEKAIGLIQSVKHGITFYVLKWKVNGKPKTKRFQDEKLAKEAWLDMHPPPNSIDNVVIIRNADGIAMLPCLHTNGILVDDDIFIKYYGKTMHLKSPNYPTLSINGKLCGLHRLIMDAKENEWVDHINSHRQDARRCNLRITDPKKNAHNRIKSTNSIGSKYVGVFRNKYSFAVRVRHNDIRHYGGSYKDEKVAAWAASQLCIQLYGKEYARKYNIDLPGYIFKNNRAMKETEEIDAKNQIDCNSEEVDDGIEMHMSKKQKTK